MPHKTAALMRFSSGSQAAALGNCKDAPWPPPGFPFFAMRPGIGIGLQPVVVLLSGGNHRHIILLSSQPS